MEEQVDTAASESESPLLRFGIRFHSWRGGHLLLHWYWGIWISGLFHVLLDLFFEGIFVKGLAAAWPTTPWAARGSTTTAKRLWPVKFSHWPPRCSAWTYVSWTNLRKMHTAQGLVRLMVSVFVWQRMHKPVLTAASATWSNDVFSTWGHGRG